MSEAENKPAKSSGGNSAAMFRQIFLVLIMLLGLAALGYDYLLARPGADQAHQKMEEVHDQQKAAKADEKIATKEKMQEIAGKAPGTVEKKDNYLLETYYWRRGLPWYSYTVTVLYEKNPNGDLLAQQFWKNQLPKPEELPAAE
jgi:hypothetical protein